MGGRGPFIAVLLLAGALTAGCLGNADSQGAPLASSAASDGDCLRHIGDIDLQTATVLDLQAALADQRITSVDLVDAYLERVLAYDEAGPRLNSIQTIASDARAQAQRLDDERRAGNVRGPLHGIPVLLKDNVGTRDMPTTAGSIALETNVPPLDAGITEKLRDAGAIILGKAQLSEFANWMSLGMPNGYSSLGGQVRNAYTLGDPSGSSSGSGVAASMAFTAAAIGTETSGSILSPSNANSLVGVKPTLGLTSRAGIIPLAPSFDVPGPMTRHVVDAAAVLSAIAGPDERDPVTAASAEHLPPNGDYLSGLRADALLGVRLGYVPDDDPHFVQALEDLERLGATLVPVEREGIDVVSLSEIALIPNEFKASLNAYLVEEAGPDIPVRSLTEIILFNQQHPDEVKYGQSLLIASEASAGVWTLAEPSALASREASRAVADHMFARDGLDALLALANSYISLGAAAGYPTVTVPAGYEEDRPRGLMFFGPAWSEARLLAYAYAYEQGTMNREPPTVVNPALVNGVCNEKASVKHTWPEGEAAATTPVAPAGEDLVDLTP